MSNLDLKTHALNVSRPTTLKLPADAQVLTPIWRPNGALGLVVLFNRDTVASQERTFLAVLKARAEAPYALDVPGDPGDPDSAYNLRYIGEGGNCLVFEVERFSSPPAPHPAPAPPKHPAPPVNPPRPKRPGRPRKNPSPEGSR